MSEIKSYTIAVPQQKLDRLKQKLALAEFPDELEDSGWDYGCPLADVKSLAKAWEEWDWRQAETKLNKLPQFHCSIEVDGFDTLDIHFIHQTSDNVAAIPLLFVHGWPGSFYEVVKLLPLLAENEGDSPAFHVVAPSLPNYGFSEAVSKKGFAGAQYAEVCHKLMQKLGYDNYVTQGGDWGFYITRALGKLYPENVRGSHINMIRAKAPTFSKHPLLAAQHSVQPYTKTERDGLKRTEWFSKEGRGYFMEQATKPQTLAYSLHDSPVALLAWIYEKLHDWTDAYPWTEDEIFTWISIYQFSRAGPGAAHRIYYETQHINSSREGMHGRSFSRDDAEAYIPYVKLGLTYNPKELGVYPKTWGRTLGDVVFETENKHGGHFYAHEHPELLARDLKTMFGKNGGAFGLIKNKNGYGLASRSRL